MLLSYLSITLHSPVLIENISILIEYFIQEGIVDILQDL